MISTGNVFEDIKRMHDKHGFPRPFPMTPRFLAFRLRFKLEELFEMVRAAETTNAEDLIDACIDLIVVAAGLLDLAGVDGLKAWDEVLRANMAKQRQDNPARTGAGGFDLIKPDGWQAPSHAGNIGNMADGLGYELRDEWPNSVTVLLECAMMQFSKGGDYHSEALQIRRADYFPHGIDDIEYELHKKHLRFRTVLDGMRSGRDPNHESLRDSLKDKINYSSFGVSMIDGKLDGQSVLDDLFRRQ